MFENYTVTTSPYDGALEMFNNFRKKSSYDIVENERNIRDLSYNILTPEEKMAICRGKIATEKDPVKLVKMKSRFRMGIYDFRDL